MTGKISSLPEHIRQQLHRRLADGQTESDILPWLNSLPETQALLAQKFDSHPVSSQNLTNYRQNTFRHWQTQQSALEFLHSFNQDQDRSGSEHSDHLASAPIIEKLLNWVCIRLAAAAQNCPPAEDPQSELREIRAFLADLVALRRGELMSRRIAIEQQRLERQIAQSDQKLEQLFWEWTKRPDIAAKLTPHRDPDKLREQVVSLLDQHFLGARATFPLEPTPPEPPPPTPANPDTHPSPAHPVPATPANSNSTPDNSAPVDSTPEPSAPADSTIENAQCPQLSVPFKPPIHDDRFSHTPPDSTPIDSATMDSPTAHPPTALPAVPGSGLDPSASPFTIPPSPAPITAPVLLLNTLYGGVLESAAPIPLSRVSVRENQPESR